MVNSYENYNHGNVKRRYRKTLNTFNIAGILAENSKVLLIDIDPQCDLTSNCGIDSSNTEVKTIRDIFENLPKIQPAAKEVIMKAPIPELPNLDLILPVSCYSKRKKCCPPGATRNIYWITFTK